VTLVTSSQEQQQARRENSIMPSDRTPSNATDRAALAFMALPAQAASDVLRRLGPVERSRLTAAVSRLEIAPTNDRVAALSFLAENLADRIEWPAHDHRGCAFTEVNSASADNIAEVLERMAVREALPVAVTLCHLDENSRDRIWRGLSNDARAAILSQLPDVPSVTRLATERTARDVILRLSLHG
jgi:hypothetical protein